MAPSGATAYTLTIGSTALTLYRLVGDGFERWFDEDGDYTANKILRGSARQVVIDVAGASWPPLTLEVECANAAAVATLRGLARQSGTLSNTRGRSASVYLARVREPEREGLYGVVAEITVERLS